MIRDTYESQIKKALTPQAITALSKDIASYVDRNSEILLSLDLSKRYSFGNSDRDVIYRTIGVTEDELIEAIKASKYINNTNKVQSNPFYTATMLLLHHLHNAKKKDDCIRVMTYMSLMMYTSIHKGLFKYNPNKQIMDYTIAHLDQSFRIRSMPSLFAFIQDNATVTYETYTDRIKRCDDKDITWVVDALWNRVKGKMKKIASAFYKNYEEGRYLNADSDNYSEGDYHEIDNNSYMIERLANKVQLKLINRQFDNRFLKYAITRSDVSLQKLKNLIDDIIQDDENNVMKLVISAIIEYYVSMSGKGFDYIAKGDFITYMQTAYASNTELQQMQFIKSTLDKWLDEYMVSSGRARYGKTAKAGYKKAIYMFLVFIINSEAKIN